MVNLIEISFQTNYQLGKSGFAINKFIILWRFYSMPARFGKVE